ncbi:MAG: SDR family NAD(P)-dependent oxidoreductase [Hyphomicrobium sp.]
MKPFHQIAGYWIARKRADPEMLAAANDAVANLKPVVVVTGGSRGIGLALAQRFAEAGDSVMLVARAQDELDKAAAQIRAKVTGATVLTASIDLTQPHAAPLLEQHLRAAGNYADVLVNNAAIGLAGPFHEASTDELQALVGLNVGAPTVLMAYFLPGMLGRRRGGILNIGSLGGAVPGPGQSAYYASKSYLQALSEAAAAEYAGCGVRISALLPGPVNTTFHASMGAEQSPYRLLLPALSPERAARAGYNGFAFGKRVIVPGLFNKVMYVAVRMLPHPVTMPFVKFLLRTSD